MIFVNARCQGVRLGGCVGDFDVAAEDDPFSEVDGTMDFEVATILQGWDGEKALLELVDELVMIRVEIDGWGLAVQFLGEHDARIVSDLAGIRAECEQVGSGFDWRKAAARHIDSGGVVE